MVKQILRACSRFLYDNGYGIGKTGSYYGRSVGSMSVYSEGAFSCTIHFYEDRLEVRPRRLPDWDWKGITIGDSVGTILYADPTMLDKLLKLVQVASTGQ